MNSIVNIGASTYSQMKKIKKEDENDDTTVDENKDKPVKGLS